VTSRFPKGSFEDLHVARISRSLWSASFVTAGTLVIVGDRDPVAPLDHAGASMRDLTHARSPKLVVRKGATHFAQFEAGRSESFEAVDPFPRDANRGSQALSR
jgi:pimeloyl-ACP methyl ester carboxylesterase